MLAGGPSDPKGRELPSLTLVFCILCRRVSTFSAPPQGIVMKREFRVTDQGEEIHVREDICKGADAMTHKEKKIPKKTASK